MPSLLDIAPPEVASETIVLIRGDTKTELPLRGLSLHQMTRLVARFPIMGKRLLSDGHLSQDDMTPEMMVEAADMMPAMIAAGFNTPDEEGERLVRERLTEDEQREAFEKVMRLTGGGKAGIHTPFANGGDAAAQSGEETDTNSLKPLTS